MLLSVIDRVDASLTIVIKEHPSDPRTYTELHDRHSRIKFVSGDTESLIRNAQAVITLNSSVGIEAAMLEKKVIVLGNACYSIEGMMQMAQTAQELVAKINELSNWSVSLDITRAFFTYLNSDYLLPGAWQGQIDGVDIKHKRRLEEKMLEVLS